jgi:N-acetylneuraminic acid mutarotase
MAGPRWEAGTVVRDNKLYVFGGYRMPTKACKRVDVSDLALLPSGQWQALAELPRPLSSPVAAILRDQLFIGGGSPNGATPQTAMWVWNTAFSLP